MTILSQGNQGRLERSCGGSPHDWIRFSPSQPGLERIEAFFKGHAYDPVWPKYPNALTAQGFAANPSRPI